jgi:hypothetical protein
MADFDPYSIIEHVMNNSLVDLPRPTPLCELQLCLVNFVLVLAYGSSRCQVIPKDQFCILQRHDVLLCYDRSIPIPPAVDWLCCELQAPFGNYADIVALGIAYFSLLDNNRSIEERVVDPNTVRSDLLRYSLFYYLLRVDTNMSQLASRHVCEHSDERVRFVYTRMQDYCNRLVHYEGPWDSMPNATLPLESFITSLHRMILSVSSCVAADCLTSRNFDSSC